MRSKYPQQRSPDPLIPASVYFAVIILMAGLASGAAYIGSTNKPQQTRVYVAENLINLPPQSSGRNAVSGSPSISPVTREKAESAASKREVLSVIVVDRSAAVLLSDVGAR